MSTSIDNRVVELQFDNKNFEKNVGSTMSTLDRLEAKLGFKGAQRGFHDVEKAASHCDLSSLGKAAEMIQSRFSSMGLVGMAAINRITNSAMAAGQRMINSLTLAPITQGYQEYELKMGSIQTIMASTGASIETVNGYLEELNRYSDRTIYSFSDMTQNIGKFTNAGVALEDAVLAIQGISNEAAVSGANAQEASRAMYNFSQALSAGYVKLIDWKSIENANMATREFKQELINTAVAMGTLKSQGNGMYKSGRVLMNATKNFNDSLQTQWMTSEVLIETLSRYADETTDIGKKAFAAAQDIKTFSQLMDTIKESIGSGWAQVSELIFGDLEEAKMLWTSIGSAVSKAVDGFFGPITDFLAANLSSNYKKFLKEGPIKNVDEFQESLKDARAKRMEQIQGMVDDNNTAIAEYKKTQKEWLKYNDYLEAKKDSWYYEDPETGQRIGWMNKPEELKHTAEEIEHMEAMNEHWNKSLNDTRINAQDLGNALVMEFDKSAAAMERYTNAGYSYKEALKEMGMTDEEYKEQMRWREGIQNGTIDVEDLAKALNEMPRHTKVIKALGNTFKYLGSYLKPVSKAFTEIFFGEGYDGNWLGALIDRFYTFSLGLKKPTQLLEQLTGGFKGLFQIAKYGIQAIKQIGSGIWTFISPVVDGLKTFGEGLLHVFSNAEYFADSLKEIIDTQVLATETAAILTKAWTTLKDIFNTLIDSLRKIEPINKIVTEFENIQKAIETGVTTGDWKAFDAIITGYYNTVYEKVSKVYNLLKDLSFSEIIDKLEIKLREYWEKIKKYTGEIGNSLTTFSDSLKADHGIDVSRIPALVVLGTFIYLLVSLISGLTAVSKSISKVFLGLYKIEKSISGVFNSIKKYFDSKALINKATAFTIAAKGVFVLATATAVLAGAMWIVAKIDPAKLTQAGITIGIMIGVLSLVAIMSAKFSGGKGSFEILGIAASIAILVLAAQKLQDIDFGKLKWSTIFGLGLIFGIFEFMALQAALASKFAPNIAKSALAMLLIVGDMLALVYALKVLANVKLSHKEIKNLFVNLYFAILSLLGLSEVMSIGGKNPLKSGIGMLAMITSLMLLVPAFFLLSKIPQEMIKKATKTILLMALPMGALMLLTRIAGPNAHKAGAAILAMAFALLPITAVIAMLGHMDSKEVWLGVSAISVIILMMSILVGAMSLIRASYKTLLGLALVLASVAVVIGVLSALKVEKVLPVGLMLTLLITSLGFLVSMAVKIPENMMVRATLLMTSLVALVAVMGVVIWGLSKIENVDAARQNAIILAGLIVVLTLVADEMGNLGKEGPKILLGSAMLALLVVVTGMLGVVVWGLSLIKNPDQAIKNASAMAILLLALVPIGYVMGNLGKLGPKILLGSAMLALLSLALIPLVGVIWGLSKIGNPEQAMKNAVTVSMLLAVLTPIGGAMSLLGKLGPKILIGSAMLALLSAAVGVLSGVVYLLSKIENPEQARKNAITVSMLLMVLTSIGSAMGLLGKLGPKILIGAALLALLNVAVGILAGVVYLLSKIDNPEQAMKNAVTVSMLLMVLTPIAGAMGILGKLGPKILIGSAMLAIMVGVAGLMSAVVLGLSKIENPEQARKNAITLGLLLLALTLLSGPLSILGLLGPSILIGAGMLAIMVGVAGLMAIVVSALSHIDNVDAARQNAITLGLLLAELSALSLVMSVVGLTGPAALVGIGVLGTIVGAILGVLALLAKFDTDGAKMDAILSKMPQLEALFNGVGRVVGNFYAGISEAIIDSVVASSAKLKDITTNLVSAFDPILGMSDDVTGKTGKLLGAIAMLAGADGLATLVTLFDTVFGGDKIGKFKTSVTGKTGGEAAEKSPLGKMIEEFGSTIDGLVQIVDKYDWSKIGKLDKVSQIGKTFADMAAAMPTEGGIVSWFTGDTVDAKTFADGMGAYIDMIMGLDMSKADSIDVNKIQNIADAGSALAGMAKELPNEGGLLGWIVGDQGGTGHNSDKKTFGQQMESFTTSLVTISDSLPDGFDPSKFELIRQAGEKLAALGDIIPNDGGLWGMIVGNNDSETFGKQFQAFTEALVHMNTDVSVNDINGSTFDGLVAAATDLTLVSDRIKGTDTTKMGHFKRAMKDFTGWIKDFIPVYKKNTEDLKSGMFTDLSTAATELSTVATSITTINTDSFNSFKTGIESFTSWVTGYAVAATESGVTATTFSPLKLATDELIRICSATAGADTSGFTGFQTAIDGYVSWASTLGGSVTEGLDPLSGVAESMASVTESIANGLDSVTQTMAALGIGMMASLTEGIAKGKHNAVNQASQVASAAANAMGGLYGSGHSSGSNLIQGFIDGMEFKEGTANSTAYRIGQNAVKNLDKGAGNASPSKLTRKSGRFLDMGLILGMQDMADDVNAAGFNIGTASMNAIDEAIHNISSVIDSDINLNPVIRPVVDMTDVDESARTISALYNNSQVATVASGKRRADNAQLGSDAVSTPSGDTNVSFVQNNYSPKALSRIDIYRNTNNQLSLAKGALKPNGK